MRILTSKSMSMCDQRSMIDQGVDEIYLVKKAAKACFEKIIDKISINSKIIVVCGNSNNSSDGFCLASILNSKGYKVKVLYLFDKSKMNKTCSYFYSEDLITDDINCLNKADVLIDCIIGNGLNGKVREDVVKVLEVMNASNAYKIAIDLPTGLNATTGNYDPICFLADLTVAINNIKLGHFLNKGPDVCGKIRIADIGLNNYDDLEHVDTIKLDIKSKRLTYSNKYDYGSVLVIGSNTSMAGAGIMSAISALKAGCGLVTLAVPENNYDIVAIKAPYEVMVKKLTDIDDLLVKKDTVVFGPGLGREGDYKELLISLLKKDINLIVDADGLYYLAKIESVPLIKKCRLCITPHYGEAATLLKKTSSDIKEDPFNCFKELINKYACVVVLKGHNTLVGNKDHYYLSLYGNSGMATAGSGDVLSGVIAGVSTKQLDLYKVCQAVAVHGFAGNEASKRYGETSLIASDIYNMLYLAFES